MTTARWTKRALIGATAALMIGGGIGVAANAAAPRVHTTTVYTWEH